MQNRILTRINLVIDSKATDSTQKKAIKVSLIFTAILWLVLFVFFAVSPAFKNQEKYKTVKIVLEPISNKPIKELKQESSNAIKKNQTAEKSQNHVSENKTPIVEKKSSPKNTVPSKQTTSAPVQKQNQNQQTQKNNQSTESYKKSSYTIKKDLEQSWEEQTSSKKSSYTDADFDSMFEKSSVTSSSATSQNVQKPSSVAQKDALQGTAGTLSSSSNSPISATPSSNSNSAQSFVSESTMNSLGKIVAALSSSNGELNAVPFSNSSRSSDGKVSVKLVDGSSRLLIDPKEPVIKVSPENASYIDSSRTVLISFKILASGNVPSSTIVFRPTAALPEPIQSEIKEQISRWRFEQAKNDGQAGFEYSIILR